VNQDYPVSQANLYIERIINLYQHLQNYLTLFITKSYRKNKIYEALTNLFCFFSNRINGVEGFKKLNFNSLKIYASLHDIFLFFRDNIDSISIVYPKKYCIFARNFKSIIYEPL